jgi:transposase InsO family protein
MVKVNQPTRGHTLLVNISGWKEVRNMAPHLRRFDSSEIAKERLRIIKYYSKYGEKACIEAFGVNRKLIHVWRKRMKLRGNHTSALVPTSTRPKNTRIMLVNPKVLEHIKHLREVHPRLGKAKIKPLLDEYCATNNLPIYSESKIGRIISKHSLFYQSNGRIYHNPDINYKQRKKVKRSRVKYAPKPSDLGHIQMDTVIRIENGIRYYLYSAIDIKGKFALSLSYKRANTKNTLDFFEKLMYVYPGKIVSVQTDNGSEFLGMFEEHLARKGIKHYFIYPRCPRINGVVERFNRSLQEEFVDPNIHLIHNQEEFQRKLADYIIFYNTKRVHQTLNYETPVDYILKEGGMSNMYRART